ncbi:kinase, partial [Dehalococcoides mccartyi]
MPFIPEDDIRLLLDSLGDLPPAEKCPFLLILVGLPGTGKSTFAGRFAKQIPVVILESDALRKTLINQPVYSDSEHTRVFKAIHELMGKLLGQSV